MLLKPNEKSIRQVDSGLRRFAAQKGLQPADAADLAQETWLAYLSAEQRFEGRSSRATYLTGILKNKIHESRRKPMFEEIPHAAAAEGTPADSVTAHETVAKVFECVDQLPPAQKTALHDRAWEGKDVTSIARHMRLTANHVSVLLHRARTHMTQCLDHHLPWA